MACVSYSSARIIPMSSLDDPELEGNRSSMNQDNDRLYSPEQLAEYLGVPVATIYMWNHRKTGPKRISVGKHTRYRKSDVERWLDGRPETAGTR